MDKQIAWALVIIAILIGGWYVYSGNTPSAQDTDVTATDSTATQAAPVLDAAMKASHDMQGTWQSTDDVKSQRVFNADHTASDVYDGKTLWSGQWTTFTKATAPEVSFPLEDGVVYLQLTENGKPESTLSFMVSNLADNDLQLIYLGRGGALTYKRVK